MNLITKIKITLAISTAVAKHKVNQFLVHVSQNKHKTFKQVFEDKKKFVGEKLYK